jgi:hypothetical protein
MIEAEWPLHAVAGFGLDHSTMLCLVLTVRGAGFVRR